MKKIALAIVLISAPTFAVGNSGKDPTWWDKLQFLANNPPNAFQASTSTVKPNAFGSTTCACSKR